MSLKPFAAALALSATIAFQAPATAAGFTGYYDTSNWTTTELLEGTGFIDTSGAPDSITLVGGDSGLAADTYYTILADAAGTVSFDWLYESDDDPGFDGGFYVITSLDNYIFLSTTDGETGSISFSVAAGELFGFNIYSDDGLFGPGYLTVSNFSAPLSDVTPVPEPATWAMMIAGFGLTGAALRRRRTIAVRFA